MTIVAGTGTRKLALEDETMRDYVLYRTMDKLRTLGATLVYSGGAEGFDSCLARAALLLEIPYHLYLPGPDYIDYYWKQKSVTGRNRMHMAKAMIDGAEQVFHCVTTNHRYAIRPCTDKSAHINFVRNHWLLHEADFGLVYNPNNDGGTKDGVSELRRHEIPFINVLE